MHKSDLLQGVFSGALLLLGAGAWAQTADSAPPATYKSVDPTLFAAIVAGTAPESAGAPPITNAP